MENSKTRTSLRKAVDYLISSGKIEQDGDLVEMFNLKKNTISSYINGTPGKNFLKRFEEKFQIKVSEFDESSKKGLVPFDVGASVKKSEVMLEVILSAVAELLAEKRNNSASVVREQFQAVVNARLNNEEPKQ